MANVGRPKKIKIPKAFWHRFCIDTSELDNYDSFSAHEWENYISSGSFVFKQLKFSSTISYCCIIDCNDLKKIKPEVNKLFRKNFRTTAIVKEGKKIFIWTNSGLWLEHKGIVNKIDACTVHSCKKFIEKLETLND